MVIKDYIAKPTMIFWMSFMQQTIKCRLLKYTFPISEILRKKVNKSFDDKVKQ